MPKQGPKNPFAHRVPENRTTLYLVRHGEVKSAEKGAQFTYNGHLDIDLTANGKEQAKSLETFFEEIPVDAVYSSDLKRAKFSARVVAKAKALKPIADPRFRELHFGHWEGKSMKTVLAEYGEEAFHRFRDLATFRVEGGGENLKDLHGRVIPTLKDVLEKHHGQTVMLAAHGGVNRVILFELLGTPIQRAFHLDQSYGCVNRIDFYGKGFKDPIIRYINHLPYNQEKRINLELMQGEKKP